MKNIVLLSLLLALAAGCASAPKLPPKASPDEVQVYDPETGQFPPEGYKTIGPIKIERPLGTATNELVLALRTEAAKMGADAIILQSIRRTTEGEIGNLNREERTIAEGLAVYYPTAQPQ